MKNKKSAWIPIVYCLYKLPWKRSKGLNFAEIQLVEELRCKDEGHGFDSLLSHWEFSLA
jgi:hypothetical protein